MSSSLADPHRESVETPSKFGPYEVVREIGRGGMACVYEGRHPKLESRVALKVLHPILAAQPSSAARFLREAKAASQIRHQNVVEVFDVGTQDGLPYIVMEFLEGWDLATLLAEKGPMPLKGVVEIFLPVISAVATAHRAGIVHRDLKPANLMLARRPPWSSQPVVLDFGISKLENDDLDESKLTRSESLLGTVPYMAPEVTRGAKLATVASDQYALGVMLYESATGKRPFAGESQYELMHAIVTSRVPPPSSLRPALPAEFDELVMRAMHRDPAKRYGSLVELGSALLSLGDAASFAQWKNVFLGGDQEQSPWMGASQTLSDSVLTSRDLPLRKWRFRKLSPAAWGFLAMSCVAAGTTFALFTSHRATVSDEGQRGQIARGSESAAPVLAASTEPIGMPTVGAAAATSATVATVQPTVQPTVPNAAVSPGASIPRRHAAGPAPVASRSDNASAAASTPATSAAPRAAPLRGTNGVPIFE